jgi:hypothetical protein
MIRKFLRKLFFQSISFSYQDLKNFEERFPGKCIVCSFHRFGYEMGYLNDVKPDKHLCLEKLPKEEE